MGRLFEDLRFVWIGLAATTATLICSVIVLGALAFASPGRSDSLAAMMNQLGATPGSTSTCTAWMPVSRSRDSAETTTCRRSR